MNDCVTIIERAEMALDLATRLLRFCRSHSDEYHRQRPLERSQSEDGVRFEADKILESLADERVPADARAALVRLVQQARRETPAMSDAVIARGILIALDNRCGHRWVAAYRRRPSRKLEPGDPVPVARPPWVARSISERAIIESSLSTDPAKRDDAIDRIPTLCLAPEGTSQVEVHLSPQFTDDGRPPIDPEHRSLASGAPNRGLGDFRPTTAQAAESRDGFFPFGPQHVDRQLGRLLRLIDRAAASGASMLVLPELCLSVSMEATIAEAFERAPRSLRLLVAGSFHVERDGKKRNESLTLSRGSSEPLRHHKLSSYFVTGEDGNTYEGIDVAPRKITLYLTDEGWTFTTLICKDMLSDDVREVLRALRVPLVLVPALTAKTRIFRSFAEELAISNQGIVVVANNAIATPDDEDRHLAVFATPRAGGLQKAQQEAAAIPPQPGYFLHHLNETAVRWRTD